MNNGLPPEGGAVPGEPTAPSGVGSPTAGGWPPWRVWEALLAIGALTLSQLLLGLGVGALLRRFVPNAPDRQIAIALPALIVGSHAAAWATVLWIFARRRVGFRTALRIGDPPTRALLRNYGAGIGLYILALPLLALFPPAKDQANLFTDIFRNGGPALAMLLVTAVALAPAVEEALFRGLLLPAVRRQWRFWPAALFVTAIFTALHVAQTGTYWPALAGIFACGLVLAWLRESSGSLWPSIAFHMGFNSTPFLAWLIALPFGGLPDGPLG
jgi:uncharacterized protein